MPANRPNLTLDEQSFQGLLSAAFIIQERNDRLKLAGQTAAEPQASLEPEGSICEAGRRIALRELRPRRVSPRRTLAAQLGLDVADEPGAALMARAFSGDSRRYRKRR